MKACKTCLEYKALVDFAIYKNKRTDGSIRDGIRNVCIACTNLASYKAKKNRIYGSRKQKENERSELAIQNLKKCVRCDKILSLSLFSQAKASTAKDGLSTNCKGCRAEQSRIDRGTNEKYLEEKNNKVFLDSLDLKRCSRCRNNYKKENYLKLKNGKLSAYCSTCRTVSINEWRANNVEKVTARLNSPENRAKEKAFREANKEKLNQYQKNWYLRNRLKKLEQNAQWVKNNPFKYKAIASRKSAVRRTQITKTTIEKFSIEKILDKNGSICHLCSEVIDMNLSHPDLQSFSVDHILPLSKGGTHTLDNVAPAHLYCNLLKGNKTTSDGDIRERSRHEQSEELR